MRKIAPFWGKRFTYRKSSIFKLNIRTFRDTFRSLFLYHSRLQRCCVGTTQVSAWHGKYTVLNRLPGSVCKYSWARSPVQSLTMTFPPSRLLNCYSQSLLTSVSSQKQESQPQPLNVSCRLPHGIAERLIASLSRAISVLATGRRATKILLLLGTIRNQNYFGHWLPATAL